MPTCCPGIFRASKANQRWVTDITQFPTKDGVLCAPVIKDLYDGSVVSYVIGRDQTVNLVLKTVRKAIASRSAQLILHSAQGAQYTSDRYNKELAAAGITPSMSSLGTPIDNADIELLLFNESRVGTQHLPHDYDEVTRMIEDYISFYNNVRIWLSSKMPSVEKRGKVA